MVNGSTDLMHRIFNGPTIIAIMVIAFLMLVVFLVIKALALQRKSQQKEGAPPKGHYFNKGITTYMPLGFLVSIPIGLISHNLIIAVLLGPVAGLLIGILVGKKSESKHKKELRTLTFEEQKLKTLAQRLLSVLILLSIVLYTITYIVL